MSFDLNLEFILHIYRVRSIFQQISPMQNLCSMLKQVISHKNFPYFSAYVACNLLFGIFLMSIGPLIPYIAAQEGSKQTEYSYMMTARAIGYISGSFLSRLIGKKVTLHQTIGVGVFIMGVCSVLFNLSSNFYFRSAIMFLSAAGASVQYVAVNMATIQCFKGPNLEKWVQAVFGFFSVGALISPLIVYIFQIQTYAFVGLLLLASMLMYYKLQTPEIQQNNVTKGQAIRHSLPKKQSILLAFLVLSISGAQVAFGNWVSSYAVLNGFSTKQHANVYATIFWTAILGARLFLIILPSKTTQKIHILSLSGAIGSVLSYYLIWGVDHELGMLAMCIIFGSAMSIMYPLVYAVPEQFGFKMSIDDGSMLTIFATLGEGCLPPVVGKMMGWFSYDWLIFGSLLLFFIILVLNKVSEVRLQERVTERQQDQKLAGLIDKEGIECIQMQSISNQNTVESLSQKSLPSC